MSEERQAWWAKAVLIGSVIALVCLGLGAFGYRFGILGVMPGLLLTVIGVGLAALSIVVGVIGLIVAMAKGMQAERAPLAIGVIASVVVIALMGPHLAGGSVPAIHNISTDMQDPPSFDKVVALRADAPNPLDYDAEVLAPLQSAAYPDVKTLKSAMAPAEVLSKTQKVFDDLGIEVVNVDQSANIVEGTATTRWFGFKDDVVVRVRADGAGSLVDVRSVSRVGQSDLGVNAKRILAILSGLKS